MSKNIQLQTDYNKAKSSYKGLMNGGILLLQKINKMQIIITGSLGNIGKSLTKELVAGFLSLI